VRVTGWTCFVVLARRNLRSGRGDRQSALKLVTAVTVIVTLASLLGSHSPLDVLIASAGMGLFGGCAAWVFYLAVEPAVRRAWPHLLIASTRLIDGRWRDPLVGRSLLAGVFGGVFLAAPWSLFANSMFTNAPWTLDMSRWYAWRQGFVVALIVAIAVWGFRNVLGKQWAFPTGALDG
jgi:hypothetical protein